MKTIKEKVVGVILSVIGYFVSLFLTFFFAYCWITSGHSEFIGGMFVVPSMFGYIYFADELKEWIMKKAFKKNDTQVNI